MAQNPVGGNSGECMQSRLSSQESIQSLGHSNQDLSVVSMAMYYLLPVVAVFLAVSTHQALGAHLDEPATFEERLFLSEPGIPVLTVVDPQEGAIINQISLAEPPIIMAVSPDGRHLYVEQGSLGIASIGVDDNTLEGLLSLSGTVQQIVFSRDAKYAYVATIAPACTLERCSFIDIIDVERFQVSASVPVRRSPSNPGGNICDIAVSHDGLRLFVMLGAEPFSVSVLDLTTMNFLDPLILPCCAACGIRANPDGERFHVIYGDLGYYSIVSHAVTSPHEFLSCVDFQDLQPSGFVLSSDGERAFLAAGELFGDAATQILVFDIVENQRIATVRLPTGDISLGASVAQIQAVDEVASRVYVGTHNPSSIIVVDTRLNSIVASFPDWPGAFALSRRHPRAYLAGRDSATLSIIDTESNEIVNTVGISSRHMAVVSVARTTAKPAGKGGCSIDSGKNESGWPATPVVAGGIMLMILLGWARQCRWPSVHSDPAVGGIRLCRLNPLRGIILLCILVSGLICLGASTRTQGFQ